MFAVNDELARAVDAVPAGAWAVGVSGGADSVALLGLLRERPELRLHVVHLDHETRGQESAADAAFVAELSRRWGMDVTVGRRSELEGSVVGLPHNRSARFRALRLELFRRVVARNDLDGVILGHHADDQAETVFQRLLRGSGAAGLGGMSERARIGGVTVLRPLLAIRRRMLREFLKARAIEWREDASNRNLNQQRNRVRGVIADDGGLTEALLRLGGCCREYQAWLRRSAPQLAATFLTRELADLPAPVAREAARAWLRSQLSTRDIPGEAIASLITMASDAASPPRQHFPGAVLVRRRGGKIFIER